MCVCVCVVCCEWVKVALEGEGSVCLHQAFARKKSGARRQSISASSIHDSAWLALARLATVTITQDNLLRQSHVFLDIVTLGWNYI